MLSCVGCRTGICDGRFCKQARPAAAKSYNKCKQARPTFGAVDIRLKDAGAITESIVEPLAEAFIESIVEPLADSIAQPVFTEPLDGSITQEAFIEFDCGSTISEPLADSTESIAEPLADSTESIVEPLADSIDEGEFDDEWTVVVFDASASGQDLRWYDASRGSGERMPVQFLD